uniref:Uncharacterized protein n=1 Tax=Lepeophtheirus salmonis TaxID=72036 RepID=A0A0K2TF72_LEPSM
MMLSVPRRLQKPLASLFGLLTTLRSTFSVGGISISPPKHPSRTKTSAAGLWLTSGLPDSMCPSYSPDLNSWTF